MDEREYLFICGRCKTVFSSFYGEKEAFCPKCHQHSKTPYYSKFPRGDRDFNKELPSDFHFEPPEIWPDGTKNELYSKKAKNKK